MNYIARTITPPEFINLSQTDISPLISSCDIKVLYVGENRNRTSFSKATAAAMAKTLRGSMIVGYYKEDKSDFADHGQVVTIDDEGVHFTCKTTPYGFVPTDAKIWFQTFLEQDDKGQDIEREYLMTTGYLWTKAFPEIQKPLEEGRPQSMELDSDSVKGTWTNSVKNDYEILIINDAVFSKLCILGEDVEPCFEGASIIKTDTSSNFSLNKENDNLDEEFNEHFYKSFYTFMKELQPILKGGTEQMGNDKSTLENPVVEEVTPVTEYAADDTKKEDEKKGTEKTDEKKDTASSTDEKKEDNTEMEDEKKKKEDYTLNPSVEDANVVSVEEYNTLKNKYASLEETVAALTKFKNEAELEKKKSLINQFTMLADEDKAEIVNNINNYSLDEIEAKLSIKCFRKGIFNKSEEAEIDKQVETMKSDPIITYSLPDVSKSNVPEWIQAVETNIME